MRNPASHETGPCSFSWKLHSQANESLYWDSPLAQAVHPITFPCLKNKATLEIAIVGFLAVRLCIQLPGRFCVYALLLHMFGIAGVVTLVLYP